MTPKHALLALQTCARAGRPVFVWGSPGVGKSAIVAQFASWYVTEAVPRGTFTPVNLRDCLRDIRAVLLDPVDVKGLPVPDFSTKAVHWLVANFFPRDGAGVLFLDELNAAPRLVQAALYQLVLNRCIGDYVLPDGWFVVAAGNHETDRAITERMSTALASRFIHISVEPDKDDFLEWGDANNLHPVVAAMIMAKPELLMNFDPKSAERTFSCPRTLEFASQILHAEPPELVELDVLTGTIGRGCAMELVAFKRYSSQIPDADAVIASPDSAPIPDHESPQGLGILCTLLVILARKATMTNFDAVCRYANRLSGKFGIFLVKSATSRDQNLKSTAGYIRFQASHSELMI